MLLNNDIREKLKEVFSDIKVEGKIKLVFFKETLNCPSCSEMEKLLEELKETIGIIDIEVYNKYTDSQKAEEYKVEMTPALFFENSSGKKRIVIYGFPSGYEFITLVEIIKYLGGVEFELEELTKNELSSLDKDGTLKVFVTPTCPYCPHAAITASKLALFSDRVKTEIIVVNEFPNLAYKYQVEGVPKTVVNEKIHLEGARPEYEYVKALKM